MKLLIVSHTPHYWRDGRLVGWGPTVREIDHLATLFDEVVHVAPVYREPAPDSAIGYRSDRVAVCSVAPAGGPGALAKLGILLQAPAYIRAILRELRSTDVVHVRCPASISLIAIMLLAMVRRPRIRWAKYAGNWQPNGKEAWSYTLQRWWLRKGLHRGIVTVNGRWPNQPAHVHPFFNPCLTDEELASARQVAAGKVLSQPIRLLLVGRLEAAKGVGCALQILAAVRARGIAGVLDLVGDGPERPSFERMASELGVDADVRFHGWLPRPALAPLYAQAHLMLFPTSSEGWPKVLSEAMAYGVVPVAGAVSSIPQYLGDFHTGRSFPPHDLAAFADAICWYAAHPDRWKEEAENGARAASAFTYSSYLAAVARLLELPPTRRSDGMPAASLAMVAEGIRPAEPPVVK
jgi:glycosyltransferase involved in cell wall biosynthesis